MSKYIFTWAEKYAVWVHHGSRCYWCSEPVRLFLEMEIDHVIPEHLETKPEELQRVRRDFKLSPNFIINGYRNWLPCHARCNKSKGGRLPPLTPLIFNTLEKLARDAETIRAIEHRIKNNINLDKLVAQLVVAHETHRLTRDEILAYFPEEPELIARYSGPESIQNKDVNILREEIFLDIDQHFVDFLNRKADPTSLAFWSNQVAEGQQSSAADVDVLANVSAAFFLSTEFYDSGYLVYRMYNAAFGSTIGESSLGSKHMLSVPIIRLSEFVPAIQQIGQGVIEGWGDWQTQLESNKAKFMLDFVSRSRFIFAYPTSMTPAQFVDSLNTNAGHLLSAARRNQLVNELTAGVKTRGQVLRAVAEDLTLVDAEFNRAFVLMQYFGYLRRNPDDTPDTDFTGYDFWLRKLNQFNGDYDAAEMVKAFITSDEYRQRFRSVSDSSHC